MKKHFIALTALAAFAASSQAMLIDFNGLSTGEIVTNQIPGVTISADSNGNFDIAAIFDSNNPTGGDDDLLTPSALVPVDYGNLLIIAEDNDDTDPPIGFLDDPDDERDGGILKFKYVNTFNAGEIVLIDNENDNSLLKFYSGGSLVNTINLAKTADGDDQITNWSGFSYDELHVVLDGSGGIAQVEAVPEPATMAALGMGALALLRRRRKA